MEENTNKQAQDAMASQADVEQELQKYGQLKRDFAELRQRYATLVTTVKAYEHELAQRGRLDLLIALLQMRRWPTNFAYAMRNEIMSIVYPDKHFVMPVRKRRATYDGNADTQQEETGNE